MAMEIETLRSKKDELKCELETEIQKEKSLEENIKILEEKLAIRDIEEKLTTKRESIKKLESTKAELENQFNQPKAPPAKEEATKNEQPKEDPMGVIVKEEPVSPSTPIEPAEPTEKKKKRAFF